MKNFLWSHMLVRELLDEKKALLLKEELEQENVIELKGDVSIRDAALTMANGKVSSVIVRWDGEDGIFTQQDLCEIVARFGDLDETPLFKRATFEGIRKVTPRTTLGEALAEMVYDKSGQRNIVRHLVVVENDKVVGVISVKDLIISFLMAIRKYEELLAGQHQ